MVDIKMLIFHAMVDTGRLDKADRIEIEDVVYSDDHAYARVGILAYRGRKKTPLMYWNVCVDTAREEICWDTTTHYSIKVG